MTVHGAGIPPSAPRSAPDSGPRLPTPRSRAARPLGRVGAPLMGGVPLGWRIADAYLLLAAALALELTVVGFTSWRELAGPYELGRAGRALLPLGIAAAAPFAVVSAALIEIMRKGDRARYRVIASACAAFFAGAVGYGVSTGRHLEGGLRAPFVAGVALAGFGAAFALGPRLARALAPASPRARLALGLGVLSVAVALELLNVLVLPRLYVPFHAGLAAAALLVAPFVSACWRPATEGSAGGRMGALVRAAAALVVFAACAALSPGAARSLSVADNIRLVFLTHGPVLSHVVELGALILPPAALEDEPAPDVASGPRMLDLTGRDLVLVTIDALRADHVGAYGYGRPITPNLDRLAAEGVVFEAAYSPTPHTSYAVTSLMTGKYMRPLLLQGLGDDSETWAVHLRRYGYRTAAFYPPAVFFIDPERFTPFRDRALDFEYRKVEFASAGARAGQVKAYLDRVSKGARVFLWVHLFEPHEPYEAHPEFPLGDRDEDRYDAEIAAADAGLGAIVAAARAARPGAVVIVAADHGEEFGEHGGRYHGTTVYEEQVHVPLVISAPGLLAPRRVSDPVELVDLLPTVLSGLAIPRPARVRGADLGPLLLGAPPPPGGAPSFAFAETDTQTLLARGASRLVCARKIGACALYDIQKDPGEQTDVAASNPSLVASLRGELRAIEASHGRFEIRGLHAEGKGWPEALRRGIAGDGDAATDVAALLDDADVTIRRKAGEVLFDLRRPEAAEPLRLALMRDEDDLTRRWCALALTRLGQGAPRVRDLLDDHDPAFRHLAALALAESGDDRGEDTLVAWFREAYPPEPTKAGEVKKTPRPIPFERAREIVEAFAKIRSKAALGALIDALDDVRLRPYVAGALAEIGEDAARPALAVRLGKERYQTARIAIAQALVKLGAGPELRAPLVRLLGTPDPLPDGLAIAMKADLLELVGGPRRKDLERLRRFAKSGVAMGMVVPKGGNGAGVRVLCRVRSVDGQPGEIRVGARAGGLAKLEKHDSLVPADAPELDGARSVTLPVAPSSREVEPFATLPESMHLHPGEYADLVLYATQNVDVIACAAVPLSDEMPPPPPEPWTPSPGEADEGAVEGPPVPAP